MQASRQGLIQVGTSAGWLSEEIRVYIITDFPENACQIPKSLTELSRGFPHLVLQSLEIRPVKCHGAFNVAYLQIVWTRLLLTEEQHVCCECSACSKTPWNTQKGAEQQQHTKKTCGAAKDLCASHLNLCAQIYRNLLMASVRGRARPLVLLFFADKTYFTSYYTYLGKTALLSPGPDHFLWYLLLSQIGSKNY